MKAGILLILLFFNVSIETLFSQTDVVKITHTNTHKSIGMSSKKYVDMTGINSIEEVLSKDIQDKFLISDQDVINIGITNSALWLKFSLINHIHEPCFLEITNFALDSIALYEVVNGTLTKTVQKGNYVAFNDLEARYNTFLFELTNFSDEAKEYYVRVKHTRGTQFSINVVTMKGFGERHHKFDFVQGVYFGFMLLMILYNLFIYFTIKDIAYIYYVLYGAFITLLNGSLTGYGFEYLWPNIPVINDYQDFFGVLSCATGIFFTTNFLNTKVNSPNFHKIFMGFLYCFVLISIIIFSGFTMLGTILTEGFSFLLIILFFITAMRMYLNGYKQAKYFLYAWTVLMIGVFVFILKDFALFPYNALTIYSLQIGSALEALILSFALADKINIYKAEKESAQEKMLLSLQENEKLIRNQNTILENKVSERTALLNQSIEDLKAAQNQLIQSEKMASLGQLTAGIAHEIQNPLNFVNNFSEVSTELVDELNEELDKGSFEEAKAIALDLKQNLIKINNHGKRADNIVKGMLQHSRSNTGIKEPTDINNLCNEYLKLAYHGFQANDKTFRINTETHFDPILPKVNIIPQDMSRVILNLLNNAFYACIERSKKEEQNYIPKVSITTQLISNEYISITIKDNGTGIPNQIKDKIFQPFFTTKPNGLGTGLGLSLTFDIIQKGHNGTIEVLSEVDMGTEFKVTLPIKTTSL
jgi:signal transduction histidine kinase